MKKHRNKIIAAAFVLCVLAGTWMWGGNYAVRDDAVSRPPSVSGASASVETPETDAETKTGVGTDVLPSADEIAADEASAVAAGRSGGAPQADEIPPSDASAPDRTASETPPNESVRVAEESPGETPPPAAQSPAAQQGQEIDPETGKDKYLTEPVPAGKPIPVEPQSAVVGDKTLTCTLSVRCDTILDNMKLLDKEKHELVPPDGVIFPPTTVTFHEGESVFNILQREMKRAGIHMEFVNTPIYNSAYIEGINNLYEFDVGELSGWMYKVNDWYPGYGCSRYQAEDGDRIEWTYTCDLGRDLGEYWLGRDYFEKH
jgi:hypothetical protein